VILTFEDVALSMRRAQSHGLVARFVVAEPFEYKHGDQLIRLEAEEEISAETVPSVLGWVSLGLRLNPWLG
jgi:hypothetical protein